METKHTKGEWKSYVSLADNSHKVKSKEKFVAKTLDLSEESEANAKLIAAAPELLEALIKLNDYFFCEKPISDGEYSDLITLTNNAIKKATE